MFRNILLFVKYPSVAGIIISVWAGSGVLVLQSRQMPIMTVVVINLLTSIVIGVVGFRVDKQ